MNQQGSQFQSGFSQSPSGPLESFNLKIQEWLKQANLYQSGIFAIDNVDSERKKANLAQVFKLIGESSTLLERGAALQDWGKQALKAEAVFNKTIWLKPHETRGKMQLEEAYVLLGKVDIKPSSSFLSSDVEWKSPSTEKNMKELGLPVKSMETATLDVEQLRESINSWKLCKQKLTPAFGVTQSVESVNSSINDSILKLNRGTSQLLAILHRDASKAIDSGAETEAPREFFIRTMTPAERTHPYGKSVYKLHYGNAEFEICSKGVIFDRNELAIVIGDDDANRRKFKEQLRNKFPNKFPSDSNPYVENFKHLSQQILDREEKRGKWMEEIKTELPYLDPDKGVDNADAALTKVMQLYAKINNIKKDKFDFLEGPEDSTGYGSGGSGPSGYRPGGSGPSGYSSGGSGYGSGGSTSGGPGGSGSSGSSPSGGSPSQGGSGGASMANPTGGTQQAAGTPSTSMGPASVPSNQSSPEKPSSNPNIVQNIDKDNQMGGRTRPPMSPGK